MTGLLSRAELPSWLTPCPVFPADHLYPIFYAFGDCIREYIYVAHAGEHSLHQVWTHWPGKAPTEGGDVLYSWPGEVSIAAGVECLRRSK